MIERATVGFDIDGTLTEDNGVDNVWDREILNYFGKSRLNNSYDFKVAFGLSQEDINNFYRDRVPDIYNTVPIKPWCREVTHALSNAGVRIVLITARDEEHRDITLSYLERQNIAYDEVVFNSNKVEVCLHRGICFFVDDKAETCQALSDAGIPCVMVNAFHNSHIDYSPRADDWRTIANHALSVLGLSAVNSKLSEMAASLDI